MTDANRYSPLRLVRVCGGLALYTLFSVTAFTADVWSCLAFLSFSGLWPATPPVADAAEVAAWGSCHE